MVSLFLIFILFLRDQDDHFLKIWGSKWTKIKVQGLKWIKVKSIRTEIKMNQIVLKEKKKKLYCICILRGIWQPALCYSHMESIIWSILSLYSHMLPFSITIIPLFFFLSSYLSILAILNCILLSYILVLLYFFFMLVGLFFNSTFNV